MSRLRAPTTSVRKWTAQELRRMSATERDAILQAAAERAEADYRGDLKLTDFGAFGKEDVHGDSANAESR